jgi:outer membrane protein insertion porin family
MEQSVPLQRDWLNFNRFTLRADRSLPLGPLRLWACAKGGAIVGDLPPYEAFPIGGTNSVRGYPEGGVGAGRNYAAATAEVHFPLVAPLQGSLFADFGSDLGSGASVPGDPAGCRQKPGAGYGAGAGVRIDTPIGPLRLEYAVNDARHRRFHLGIGSHG